MTTLTELFRKSASTHSARAAVEDPVQVDQEREDHGYYEVLLGQRGSAASALSPQGIIGVDELKSQASHKARKEKD